jgi:hypothetical protein
VVSVASPLLHLANYLGLLYHIIQSKGNNRIHLNQSILTFSHVHRLANPKKEKNKKNPASLKEAGLVL